MPAIGDMVGPFGGGDRVAKAERRSEKASRKFNEATERLAEGLPYEKWQRCLLEMLEADAERDAALVEAGRGDECHLPKFAAAAVTDGGKPELLYTAIVEMIVDGTYRTYEDFRGAYFGVAIAVEEDARADAP